MVKRLTAEYRAVIGREYERRAEERRTREEMRRQVVKVRRSMEWNGHCYEGEESEGVAVV